MVDIQTAACEMATVRLQGTRSDVLMDWTDLTFVGDVTDLGLAMSLGQQPVHLKHGLRGSLFTTTCAGLGRGA